MNLDTESSFCISIPTEKVSSRPTKKIALLEYPVETGACLASQTARHTYRPQPLLFYLDNESLSSFFVSSNTSINRDKSADMH